VGNGGEKVEIGEKRKKGKDYKKGSDRSLQRQTKAEAQSHWGKGNHHSDYQKRWNAKSKKSAG